MGLVRASIFRTVRNSPFAGMLYRIARRKGGAKTLDGRQCFHARAPAAKQRIFRIHRLAFFGQPECIRARQHEEICKRELAAEDVIGPVAKRLLQDVERALDLWQIMYG